MTPKPLNGAVLAENPPWNKEGPGWVSWNCVFTGPFGFDLPFAAGGYSPVGWYDCQYDDRSVFFTTGGRPRYLDASDPALQKAPPDGPGLTLPTPQTHPFSMLFLQDSP